jgi:hypothetical protein
MKNDKTPPTCWIITEGMAGTENQCIGVAQALGLEPKIIRIGLRQPWKLLSPWLGLEQSWTFTPSLTPDTKEGWPDLLIAAGRKSIAASRYIKKQSGGKTFTVQIQDPKTSPHQFDLVAVPHHDLLRGDNVIVTHGAPNKITREKLEEARAEFAALFTDIPKPRVAVLIGGNSRTHKMTKNITEKLTTQLQALDAGLMITASRRTGEENTKILRSALKGANNFFWDGQAANPYFGMLAWADHIIVTSDSVSMLSDACTTGKPVHMIELEGSSPRFDRFHNHIIETGAVRRFDGNLAEWSYEPFNDAGFIANKIIEKMG